MSKAFKINEELTIHVVESMVDPLLSNKFYEDLYNGVFVDPDNNAKAGLANMNTVRDVKTKVEAWLSELSGVFNCIFFLFKGKDVIGTTEVFDALALGMDTVSLGYIVSPIHQGRGYGTLMLGFVADYLSKKGLKVTLGFRDGNFASEKIASKCNFSYLLRTTATDYTGATRPITYYKYNDKPLMNESYSVIPKNKLLTTNQWVDNNGKILTRVNPKMISLEEFVYFSTSNNKPVALKETYYVFTSPHYKLSESLREEKIKAPYIAITDTDAYKLFNPSVHGDIVLDDFSELIESNLIIQDVDKKNGTVTMSNEYGRVRMRVIDKMLLIENYELY